MRHLKEPPFWEIITSVWTEDPPSIEFIDLMKAALSSPGEERTSGLFQLRFLPGQCCLSVGGHSEWADEFSAAWYLFYLAAHLMDAVEDRDPQEDWWTGQSPTIGINAATGLYFTANAVLNRLGQSSITQPSAPLILADFYHTLLIMASGQHTDLSKVDLTLEQYWQVAADKSGTFFSLACRSGARLGNGSQDQVDALSQYGKELGILIQILDDLDAVHDYLDPDAEAERIHFRHTLPAVYALQLSPENKKNHLSSLITEAPSNLLKAQEVFDMIEASGAGLYMLAEVQRHRAKALAALDETSLAERPKEILAGLVEMMTTPPDS